MPTLKELNNTVSLQDQMQTNEDGSIVLINVFTIDPADEEALLASWSHDAAFMKEQPDILKEIEWKLQAVWKEYKEILEEGEDQKAKKLLNEYQELRMLYKKQKILLDLD